MFHVDWRFAAIGYAAAAVVTFAYLEKRDDLAEAIERCNTEKMQAIAEAQSVAREAGERAAATHLAELDRMAKELEAAEHELWQASVQNRDKTDEVTRIIEEQSDEPDSCLNELVPGPIVERLR